MLILDDTDHRILRVLQEDATVSMDVLSDYVALSRNACWTRIRKMEEAGVIRGRVTLVDPGLVGCPLMVVVLIKTSDHDTDWLDQFAAVVQSMPEVLGAYRMAGDLDYMLRIRVASVAAYDSFYKELIEMIPLTDISASFVMEEIKETQAVPLIKK